MLQAGYVLHRGRGGFVTAGPTGVALVPEDLAQSAMQVVSGNGDVGAFVMGAQSQGRSVFFLDLGRPTPLLSFFGDIAVRAWSWGTDEAKPLTGPLFASSVDPAAWSAVEVWWTGEGYTEGVWLPLWLGAAAAGVVRIGHAGTASNVPGIAASAAQSSAVVPAAAAAPVSQEPVVVPEPVVAPEPAEAPQVADQSPANEISPQPEPSVPAAEISPQPEPPAPALPGWGAAAGIASAGVAGAAGLATAVPPPPAPTLPPVPPLPTVPAFPPPTGAPVMLEAPHEPVAAPSVPSWPAPSAPSAVEVEPEPEPVAAEPEPEPEPVQPESEPVWPAPSTEPVQPDPQPVQPEPPEQQPEPIPAADTATQAQTDPDAPSAGQFAPAPESVDEADLPMTQPLIMPFDDGPVATPEPAAMPLPAAPEPAPVPDPAAAWAADSAPVATPPVARVDTPVPPPAPEVPAAESTLSWIPGFGAGHPAPVAPEADVNPEIFEETISPAQLEELRRQREATVQPTQAKARESFLVYAGTAPIAVTLDIVLGRDPDMRALTGRPPAMTLRVPSPASEVSRTHCAVMPGINGTAGVMDLGSSNGTTLRRASGEVLPLSPMVAVELRDGDAIDLGDGAVVEYRVREG